MNGDADLMGIGRHCCYESCGQVDFLPFTCDCCKSTFCLEHRTYAAHACTKAAGKTTDVILCPVCAKAVRLVPGEDVNATFERHTLSNCDPSNYSKVHKKPKCPARGCKDKLVTTNTYTCKSCSTRVCLKHRLPDDHQCSSRQGRPLAAASGRQQGGGLAGTSMVSNWFGTAPSSKPTPNPSLAPRNPGAQRQPDYLEPGNTVMGTAARRRQQASSTPAPAAAARPPPRNSEVCPQCGAAFSTVADLIQHSEEYHPAAAAGPSSVTGRPAGAFVCTKCGQAFSDAVQLVSHDERQHAARPQARRSECVVS